MARNQKEWNKTDVVAFGREDIEELRSTFGFHKATSHLAQARFLISVHQGMWDEWPYEELLGACLFWAAVRHDGALSSTEIAEELSVPEPTIVRIYEIIENERD